MIKYSIAMSIRVLCIFACSSLDGWWLAVFAAGAIFLPYFAVVLANVPGSTSVSPCCGRVRSCAALPRRPSRPTARRAEHPTSPAPTSGPTAVTTNAAPRDRRTRRVARPRHVLARGVP